ncbi:MFS transporter [Escherichia coli]|uniref:galactose/proton symporter n=1 Tax=Escherichia coli TaxID=562 RepID=UPI000A3B31A0|nr:galactose/proton symporter [Escherichia coli]OUK55017.1 MFS transporter [Escherichia coli]
MPDAKKQGRSNKAMTFFVCFLAALAGLLFGLDIGVIAGALPFIADEFQITSHTQEWVVSSMMFGAAVGAVGSGWLSFKLGRKKSLMIGAILFVAGSLFSAAAPNVEVLILSRVLLGLAVGGSMISMYQLMITIGILGAYLSDTAFSYTGAWRWMLGVIIIPAILLLIGVFFLPDSPRWFAAKRRFVDAERVLLRLRDTSAEAKRELDEIRESLQVKQSGWALFKENSNFRRAVFLGVLLQVMQQFTGMNVIMYYAPKIFELAGYTNTTEQMWGTVIVGLTNVLATFIAIGLVDRWGRKPTLTLGFLVMAAGMGVLGTMMHIGIHSPSAQYFAIAMLLMFIVGFAMSAGPLIWVLCSEIQPLKGRDFGITCSTATNWIANMIVGATFLTMLNTLGNANTFWVYAALNVLFILLTLWLVPETKHVSLEHIERNLMKGRKLREIGAHD